MMSKTFYPLVGMALTLLMASAPQPAFAGGLMNLRKQMFQRSSIRNPNDKPLARTRLLQFHFYERFRPHRRDTFDFQRKVYTFGKHRVRLIDRRQISYRRNQILPNWRRVTFGRHPNVIRATKEGRFTVRDFREGGMIIRKIER